ncbi:hypothetical protein [Actinomadura oligospora]|uniref:hypothetical protein n=1 Tax=Actinomadura oligospora TaxID=111804 RepID=UPI00047EFD3C|nr:hypothetical protein [Actinomadura oligospora]
MSERWNRRLLHAYPQRHRAEYGEEMLDVLAECGGGPRESLTLVLGGLRTRLGGLGAPYATPEWRDALAVASLVAPLLMTISTVWFADSTVRALTGELATSPGYWSGFAGWVPVWASGAVITAAAWWGGLHGRRFAMVALLALCAYMFTGHTPLTVSMYGTIALSLVVPVVALAGLAFSDGPRRGAQVLGRRVTVPMVTVAALTFAAQGLAGLQYPLDLHLISGETPYYEYAWVIMLGVLLLNGLRTASGRRFGALLVAPLLDLGHLVAVPSPRTAELALALVLVLALGVRSRPRSRPAT